MRQFAVKIIIFLLLNIFTQLLGWGYDVHRRITKSAARAVTGEFGNFVNKHINEISYHAADPDFWKEADPSEGSRHFIDADLYDDFPFANIPRDIDSLNSKYGEETVNQCGTAPWTIDDYCKRLTDSFNNKQWKESIYVMSAMSHYIADIHMPLHTSGNYNGQLSGNEGIHFRWEVSMVEKHVSYIESLNSAQVILNNLEMAFNIVKESYSVHHILLGADTNARAPLTKVQADSLNTYESLSFEDEYLAILYSQTADIVHDRLNSAAERIASYWYTCWIEAGSPTIPENLQL